MPVLPLTLNSPMETLETIEEDRPERDLERIANDSLDSSADDARAAAKEHLKAYNDTLEESGKPFPKRGKAAAILRELITAEGYALTESELIEASGTGYVRNAVASLRERGWIITASNQFTRDRGGRRIQKTVYSLDQANNSITTN